jgi:hypothetical protein
MKGKGLSIKVQAVCLIFLMAVGLLSGTVLNPGFTKTESQLDTMDLAPMESENRGARSNGDVDFIIIVDSEGTGSNEITNQTVPYNFTVQGWAAGFNNTNGYVGDIPVNWTVINTTSTATTSPDNGTNSTFDADNNGGQATWIADDGAGHLDQVIFTITAPTIDFIIIVDSGGTGASEIPDQSVSVGTSITGWAAAFNSTSGYISDVSVTWSVTNNDGSTASTFPLLGFSSTFDADVNPGNATWEADDGAGHNDTVSFNIIAPAIEYITIVDTEGTGVNEIPDQTVSYNFTIQGWAAAFNNSVGYIGDISVTWNVTNTSSSASTSPIFGSNSTFDSDVNPGTAVWTADDGAGHNDTVVFTIEIPVLDFILIVDTEDTGAIEIPDQTVDAGFMLTGYAAAFNNSAGYMWDVTVLWTVVNIGSSASTSPSSGTNSTFDAGPAGGSATWTAEDGFGHSEVVNFTINPPTLDFITIVNTSGSGAAEIPDQTVDVGFSIPGWAAAFNSSAGYMGDVTVTWTVNNMDGANSLTNPLVGITSTFDAGDSGGNATWTADDGLGHTDTVEFTINPPSVDYITIVDSASSGTNEISDQTVPFNFTVNGWAATFNNSVGYIGDISVSWSVSNTTSTATTNPLSGTNSIFDADVNSGTATWMADDGAGHNDIVEFYITDYTVDYILIVDTADTGITEIPDQTVGVGFTIEGWAAAFNNSVGHVGDVSVLWTVDNIGSSASTNPSTGTNSTFNTGESGGTATWTAEDGMGHSDVVNFTINPPTLDYIIIVDSGGSGVTEIPDQAVPVEFTIPGWAASFNNTIGYLGDISVTWTVDNVGGANGQTNPPFGITSTFDAGDSAGSATWTADDGFSHIDTVVFTINPPTVDYIVIVDSADSGTNEVSDQIVPIGFTVDGWAAAFNDSVGYIFDISVFWSVGNSGGSTASTFPLTGDMSTFDADVNTGTATWEADDGIGHIDTVVFTITNITVDSILIVDTPNMGLTEIPDQTVTVGFTITGWAAAFNDTQGYMGDISVDWSVSNVSSTATTNPSSGTSSTFDADNNGGQATWIVDDGAGHSDQVIFTITAPTIDFIVIVDSGGTGANEIPDQSVGVGFTIDGWAAAFNSTSGYINDVSVQWSVTNNGGSTASTTPLPGPTATFDADVYPGSATWEANDGVGHNDTVGFIILPPTADYILIVNSPGTGSIEIDNLTVDVGFSITGYAAAFNETVDYFQDIPVTWSVANVGSNASTSPLSGASSIFYSGWLGGTCTWTADDDSGHTDSVSVNVTAPAVDYILIVNSENAGGAEIQGMTVDIGFSVVGWAASFNDTAGFIGDMSVSWSVVNTGSNGSSEPLSGTNSTLYSGWFGGTATWTASHISGPSDSVAFTVNPPEVDYILIVDTPGGGGNEIPDKIIDVGETHTGWAAGFNITTGYVGDISVTWSVGNTGSSASTSPIFGTNSSFYAGIVEGSAILTASDGQSHTDSVVFTINPPTVDYISFRDAPDGGGNVIDEPSYPVGAQVRFYAVLFNVTSGFIANAPNTTFWDSEDEAIISLSSIGDYTDIQCSDEEHGTVLINVDDQEGNTNSTTVTVLEPTVDQLRIVDAPGSGGTEITDMLYPVGAEDTYYGVMFNETAGFLGNVPNSATWSSNRARVEVTSPGSSTTITCSDTDDGTARVTLEDGLGHEAWVDVEILPPAMDYIQLQDNGGSQGIILADHSIAGGASETYFAVAYNDTGGHIGAVDVEWFSTIPGVGSLSDTTGTQTTFTASPSETGTTAITARYQGNLSGSFAVTVNDETDPIADAGSDQTINVGEIVQFDGTDSTDSVGIVSYEWTFSDGDNTLTLEGDKVEYTFEEPDTYEITLEVTDTSGNTDTDSFFVIVEGKDDGGETGFAWWLLLIPIIVVIVVLLVVFQLLKKRTAKSICNVCGRDFYPQTDEEAASGVCPVCKSKDAEPEPVEAIIEEVTPVDETLEPASEAPEETTDSFSISTEEDEGTTEPASLATDKALLQTVQCPECAHEFSARSKTPGLMAVTCPNCKTRGEIEF